MDLMGSFKGYLNMTDGGLFILIPSLRAYVLPD